MFWRPCLCPKRLLLPAQREYIWCMSIQPQPQTPVITIPLSIISSKQINHFILFSYHSSFHQPLSQRHEDKCMRMNLPNPRFFFSPYSFIALEWHVWIILRTCSSSYLFLLSVQSCIACFTLSASEQIYLDGDLMRSRHLFLWPWELSIWAHPPLDFQHECWIILLVFEREVPI